MNSGTTIQRGKDQHTHCYKGSLCIVRWRRLWNRPGGRKGWWLRTSAKQHTPEKGQWRGFNMRKRRWVQVQSSKTTLRIKRDLVHIRMATTNIEAVRQNITKMRPSVSRLLGLTKLERIPDGAAITGSLNRSFFGTLLIKTMFADVCRSSLQWRKRRNVNEDKNILKRSGL